MATPTAISVVEEAPKQQQQHRPAPKNPLCAAVAVLSFLVVGFAASTAYFAFPSLTSDFMDDPATPAHVARTRQGFTGGEDLTEKYFSKPTLTELSDTSTSRFRRFDASFQSEGEKGNNYPASQDAYAAGVTHMMDEKGAVTHEMRLEVLESGAASLGEYSDNHGQVGSRTLRIMVDNKMSNDRFYLVPIGLSMTSFDGDDFNQTLWPDLFYFSYLHHEAKAEERVVTFCSTATFNNGSAHCFLGKGQKEWDHSVLPWAKAYLEGMVAAADSSSKEDGARRLHWWNSKSSASAAPVQHTKWHKPAEKIGGDVGAKIGNKEGSKMGGKIGGEIGGKVGGEVGEVAGTAVGGAVAGPVGAAVGGEVGHWAGKKIGKKVGEKVGKKYGGEAGTAVGRKIGGAAGGWAGDHVGTKCNGCP